MRTFVMALAASAALVTGCQTVETTKESAVGVSRPQRMLVSADEINASSEQAYHQVLAQAQQKGALDRDAAAVQRVKSIASRLIPATGALRPDAPGWKWETHVLSSDEVNAWCMPGGKIAVYTGLIQKLNATDDELAAVMGHEIGHALREHGREQASREMGEQVAVGIASAVLGLPDIAQQLAPMILDVTFNLPHSRQQETEADRIGVELAARAGFNPHGAVSLWEKMSKLSTQEPPKFLSTHPPHEQRLADLRQYAERVMPLYQTAKK